MSRYFVGGVVLAVLSAAPAYAEAPSGAEQTANGTIIWKAPRSGEAPASAAAPGKDTIIWNDDAPKAAPPPSQGARVPDRNGIIWNDPPPKSGATAKSEPAPLPPQTAAASPKQDEAGPCREYTSEITVEGRRQAIRGTACRQSDGRWRVLSQVPR